MPVHWFIYSSQCPHFTPRRKGLPSLMTAAGWSSQPVTDAPFFHSVTENSFLSVLAAVTPATVAESTGRWASTRSVECAHSPVSWSILACLAFFLSIFLFFVCFFVFCFALCCPGQTASLLLLPWLPAASFHAYLLTLCRHAAQTFSDPQRSMCMETYRICMMLWWRLAFFFLESLMPLVVFITVCMSRGGWGGGVGGGICLLKNLFIC